MRKDSDGTEGMEEEEWGGVGGVEENNCIEEPFVTDVGRCIELSAAVQRPFLHSCQNQLMGSDFAPISPQTRL